MARISGDKWRDSSTCSSPADWRRVYGALFALQARFGGRDYECWADAFVRPAERSDACEAQALPSSPIINFLIIQVLIPLRATPDEASGAHNLVGPLVPVARRM